MSQQLLLVSNLSFAFLIEPGNDSFQPFSSILTEASKTLQAAGTLMRQRSMLCFVSTFQESCAHHNIQTREKGHESFL